MDELLQSTFKYDRFKSYQKSVIEYILKGHDNLVIMPTGSGKSLCYQFPCLVTSKITIVISPLIAIMEQQVSELKKFNISSKYYDSNDTTDIIYDIIKYSIVFITPEKIINIINKLDVIKDHIGLFAIDECHCISEWGHDFRPSYTKLGILKQLYPIIPIIALTATATNSVESDIVNKLKLDISNTALTKSSIYRSNLKYIIRVKIDFETDMNNLYKTDQDKLIPTIIYTNTVKNTDKICNYLVDELGIKCINYYSSMDRDIKKEIHELFINDKICCLVATIAYGMGVHKNNIRRVIHYTPPASIEQYYQQVGRAGRDGNESECILYYNSTDFSLPHTKNCVEKSNIMNEYCCTNKCRNQFILNYFEDDSNIIKKIGCNCDNCILDTDVKEINLTHEIHILLKTIYYTHEIYGAGIIIDILRGSKKKSIVNKNLNSIQTYGLGKSRTIQWWKYIITIIQSKYKYIYTKPEYNNIILTSKGKHLLYINNKNDVLLKLPDIFNK
tara:strand:+ start:1799 stop:3304 length:1506 start_codon:yes stop_codon:yes gene_type:complete